MFGKLPFFGCHCAIKHSYYLVSFVLFCFDFWHKQWIVAPSCISVTLSECCNTLSSCYFLCATLSKPWWLHREDNVEAEPQTSLGAHCLVVCCRCSVRCLFGFSSGSKRLVPLVFPSLDDMWESPRPDVLHGLTHSGRRQISGGTLKSKAQV